MKSTRWDLPPVDLARRKGGRRLLVVGNVSPDHLVEICLLAARRAARRLLAGDVVGVAHVHGLGAWLPLVLDKLEWPRAHDLLDLLVRRGGRDPRGHHEGHVTRWLSQRVEHRAETFGQFERERLLVDGRDPPRVRHEKPAEAILLAPAFE